MKLNILPLSQRDARWKDKKMGGGGSIGQYGCYLTCWSMMAIYFGHEVLPDVLNEVFKSKNVYDGNYINFYAAGNVFGDIKAKEYYECEDIPCDLSKIDQLLAEKKPVIAEVDFDNNPSTKGDYHFVLIIGKNEADGAYFCNDPWYGDTIFFHARYGEPSKGIYGLRIYDGNPKIEINLQDSVNDLTDKLQSCNTALADKSLEVNKLLDDLQEQERDNADLAKQLAESRSQRDQISWENDKLKIQVKSLSEEIDSLKSQVKKKDEDIELLKNKIIQMQKSSFDEISKWDALRLTLAKFLGR